MDELTLLRSYDHEVAAPRDEVLETSRRKLENAMRLATRTHAADRRDRLPQAHRLRAVRGATRAPVNEVRTRVSRRTVLIGLGAVAATCTGVAVFNVAGGPAAPANAAETLRAAATATAASSAPVRGVTTHVLRFIASTLTDGGRSADGGPALIEETETLRPIRNGADWVSTVTAARAVRAWGKDPKQAMDSINRDPSAPAPSYLSTTSPSAFWGGLSPAEMRALPRDPKTLLRRLTSMPDEFGEARNSTERAFYAALSILGSGVADAGLQASTYRALILLPGLRASRGTDVDGRRGVLISFPPEPGKDDLALVIDPVTGRFLGSTETHVTAFRGAPAGTIERATAYYFDR